MVKRILLGGLLIVIAVIAFAMARAEHASAPVDTAHNDTASKQPTQSSPAGTFDKQRYSTTAASSPWVVVNKQHPLRPQDYAPDDLAAVGNGQLLRTEAATALQHMLAAAKSAGLAITPASAYRSYAAQVTAYNSEVKAYGQAAADSESARPGYSEHQTGWAVDLAGGGCTIEDCFKDTPEGKWATANAYTYGFILRYPEGKANVTGYRAEAWHFRYVGKPLAAEMHRQNISTLEEFFAMSGGPNY